MPEGWANVSFVMCVIINTLVFDKTVFLSSEKCFPFWLKSDGKDTDFKGILLFLNRAFLFGVLYGGGVCVF